MVAPFRHSPLSVALHLLHRPMPVLLGLVLLNFTWYSCHPISPDILRCLHLDLTNVCNTKDTGLAQQPLDDTKASLTSSTQPQIQGTTVVILETAEWVSLDL